MYNLLMVAATDYWKERETSEFEWSRFLEHTDEAIKQSFLPLDEEGIARLMTFPALFLPEFSAKAHLSTDNEIIFAYVGRIVEMRRRQTEVQFRYEFDTAFAPIPVTAIAEAAWDLDINIRGQENYRTHWAVKDVDLVEVLKRKGLFVETLPVASDIAEELRELADGATVLGGAKPKVFVVHGRDDGIKNEVARWLNKVDLDEVVLHEKPNLGRAIISKFRDIAGEAVFAVVVATPDDVGGLAGGAQSARARQNVILELGFFLGVLGPERVVLLRCDEGIELPSDYDGVVYVDYDRRGAWKLALAKEFKALGIQFNVLAGL